MHIATAEHLLPGRHPDEQFECAASLGIEGVVVAAPNMNDDKVEALANAAQHTGVRIAMIDHGKQSSILDPDWTRRESALAELRASICLARDLGAEGVVFAPHYGAALMPDLTPYMSPIELGTEMLHMHLRSLSDFSYAIGVTLYMQPLNQYETHFMNTIEQAGKVARRINHPHVKIAPHTFHMALEEADMLSAVREHTDLIGLLTLSDHNRRLPGVGLVGFESLATALTVGGYRGWVSIDADAPTDINTLQASIEMLRFAGFNGVA